MEYKKGSISKKVIDFHKKFLNCASKTAFPEVITKVIFTLLCGASKGSMKALKAFRKPFAAPQRSVKIEI